jgi:hypothetical protein
MKIHVFTKSTIKLISVKVHFLIKKNILLLKKMFHQFQNF